MKLYTTAYWKPLPSDVINGLCKRGEYLLYRPKSMLTDQGYTDVDAMKKELKHRFAHRLIGETLDKKGLIFNEDLYIQIVEGE